MNGASPVPARRINKPKTKRTTKIGSSHHFLFSLRKPHSSKNRPGRRCSAAALSNSVKRPSFINQVISGKRAGGHRKMGGYRLRGQSEAAAQRWPLFSDDQSTPKTHPK